MKRRIMLFGIFTSVLLGSASGISHAFEEIDIYPNANEINITLNNKIYNKNSNIEFFFI